MRPQHYIDTAAILQATLPNIIRQSYAIAWQTNSFTIHY